MDGHGVFSADADNVLRWLTGAGILAGLVATGVLTAVLLRRRPAGAAAVRWLLLLGLFLFPATSVLLGNVVGFSRVKGSCSECHTMDPWVRDLEDPKSETLAAKHWQNRWINENACYTCHTGYGLSGNVEAKISGLGHVLHEYVLGVPEKIAIKKPIPASTCLHCHADTPGYVKIEPHVDAELKPKILSGELSCFECHVPPHPRKTP